MKIFRVFSCAILALTTTGAWADRLDDLIERVEELESRQSELLEQVAIRRNDVKSFFPDGLTLGGFFESTFTLMTGPNNKTQGSANGHVLGLNFAAEFSDRLRFVSQFITGLGVGTTNLHNDPQIQPPQREFGSPFLITVLTQGYVEYRATEAFRIQGGLGYLPFGFAFQEREIVLFLRRGGPQVIRTASISSNQWQGLHFLGSFEKERSKWGYDLYSMTSAWNTKLPGVGGRLWWSPNDDSMTVGISALRARHTLDDYFSLLGFDFRMKFSRFSVVSEYVRHFAMTDDPWTFYVEPSVSFWEEELHFYVFADYANSARNQTGNNWDPYQKWEYGAGINWLPTSFTRFRFGVTQSDYLGHGRDFLGFDLSAGVSF
jgi:hypothetical protein